MSDYNYKVVAVLKSDLSENEMLSAVNEIKDLFFFSALKDMKNYFSRLEYYDLWGEENVSRPEKLNL